jgi:predicted nucleic acid-binding protein
MAGPKGLTSLSEAMRRPARRISAWPGDRAPQRAAEITSREVRTIDAIHLSTALYIEADEFIAYDRRQLAAAEAQGSRPQLRGSTRAPEP